MKKIETLRSRHALSVEELVAALRRRQGADPNAVRPLGAPDSIENIAVDAEVNQGRWVAYCPFCPGAELVDPDCLVMMCCSCWNEAIGGKWFRVRMPVEREQIEAALEKRPRPQTQNWTRAETAAQLERENAVRLKERRR